MSSSTCGNGFPLINLMTVCIASPGSMNFDYLRRIHYSAKCLTLRIRTRSAHTQFEYGSMADYHDIYLKCSALGRLFQEVSRNLLGTLWSRCCTLRCSSQNDTCLNGTNNRCWHLQFHRKLYPRRDLNDHHSLRSVQCPYISRHIGLGCHPSKPESHLSECE